MSTQALGQPVALPVSALLHKLCPQCEMTISSLVHMEMSLFMIPKQIIMGGWQ